MVPPPHNSANLTYGDYRRWPEGERWELIDGVAYCMTPAPSLTHQEVTGEIFGQLRTALRGSPCRPFVAPVDVLLPSGDESDDDVPSVVQPDVFVVCDESKLSDRGVRGAPDFVVEVLSPATGTKDRRQKATLYGRHGVAEYWMVDPVYGNVTVLRRREGATGFGAPTIHDGEGSLTVAALSGVTIDLDAVFALVRQ